VLELLGEPVDAKLEGAMIEPLAIDGFRGVELIL